MIDDLKHDYMVTNGVTLHVVKAGPEDGPLLILLHGFPEFWYGWRRQIPDFVAAGYRVWIPDQRGYNLSEKPAEIAAYNLDELAADVVGMIAAAGEEKAFIVGHDWGGAVAWWIANKYPQRVERLGILNVPHHAVMQRHLRTNRAQKRRSWYMLFFQVPWLPERLMGLGDWAAGLRLLTSTSRRGAFSADDLEKYRQAWSQPGAMTAMINWYRALRQNPPQRLPSPRITVPTLVIWGTGDTALGQEMAQPSIELCDEGRLVLIEKASHWVQHEEPERVNRLLLDFLGDR